MSRAQHDLLLFTLWPAACAYQGWDKLPTRDREAKRKEIAAEVFGGPKSFTKINRTKEFDAIKARLEMLAGKVSGAVEDGNPEAGERRRVMNRVGVLLAEGNELPNWENYIAPILKERFKIVPGISTIADLSNDELLKLSITLTDRIASLKAETETTPVAAGDTDNPF